MAPRKFEGKLDDYADRISETVSDGVRKIEDAFEKGKHNVDDDLDNKGGLDGFRGSPRMGVVLVIVGVIWLLHTLGALDHPILPILALGFGIYLIVRNR